MLHTTTSVSSDAALSLATAAVARAREIGVTVAVAVTDAHGTLLALIRMDGVAPAVVDFATDKAWTAAQTGKSTEAFANRMSSAPSLTMGLANRPRLIAWRGGLPVVKDGACVGGIGVSGARDEDDIACAEAALAAGGFDAAR